MIKTITITVDTGDDTYSTMVVDKIEDVIWDRLHDMGGIAILDKDGDACGKMDIFGVVVEVQSG